MSNRIHPDTDKSSEDTMPVLRRHDVVHELAPGRNVLGSSPQCNIVLGGPNIAERHSLLELSAKTSEARVSSFGVAAEVYCNGHRISMPTNVVHGDTLAFGGPDNAFTFDITMTPSVAASMAPSSVSVSEAAPMFSRSMQQPLQPSRVHASFRNEALMDQALRNFVERKLLEHAKQSSPTHLTAQIQNAIERRKRTRLSQRLRDVKRATAASMALKKSFQSAVYEQSDNDADGSADELPETLEKPAGDSAPPPSEAAHAEDNEDDDLPEMVDRASSPREASPPPPPPARTASQQARIDQRLLEKRRDILLRGWRAWRDALRRRQRLQAAAKRHHAAAVVQVAVRSHQLRRAIALRAARRRQVGAWANCFHRLEALAHKLRRRKAWRQWQLYLLSSAVALVWTHVARRYARRTALRKAVGSWKQAAGAWQQRRAWLSQRLRQLHRQRVGTAFQEWRQGLLKVTAAKLEKRYADEQARNKLLVLAIAAQTEAEATAWEEQAKETSEFLRKEAEARRHIEQLRARLQKSLRPAATQTDDDVGTAPGGPALPNADTTARQPLQGKAEVSTVASATTQTDDEPSSSLVVSAPVALTTASPAEATREVAAVAAQTDGPLSEALERDIVLETLALKQHIQSLETQLREGRAADAASVAAMTELKASFARQTSELAATQAQLDAAKAESTARATALAAATTAAKVTEATLLQRIAKLESQAAELHAKCVRTRQSRQCVVECSARNKNWLQADLQRREADAVSASLELNRTVQALEAKVAATEDSLVAANSNLAAARSTLAAANAKLAAAENEAATADNALATTTAQLQDAMARAATAEAKLQALMAKHAPAQFLSAFERSTHATEAEKQAKRLEHLETQLLVATKELDQLRREREDAAHAEHRYQATFNSTVESFLETAISNYDSRLLRCSAELDTVLSQADSDALAAQFRAASSLVGYVQEERLEHYRVLADLHDKVLCAKQRQTDAPGPLQPALSQNARFLQDMLLQRFERLLQLHQHLAAQAARTGDGYDAKKLEYAQLLATTMHARQVEFVDSCVQLYVPFPAVNGLSFDLKLDSDTVFAISSYCKMLQVS
ncbi:hypothetical protein ACHHYP_09962 [Achlya hypogyna]|uniref:FHA domain-containing protein n=1 Tax=Achlya hypogyna TaxID=1202772 RepID=A0A1V9YM58_ACHHY|nr:hypothetical protein ACHHYP_09962 [Achlya hypogyna]